MRAAEAIAAALEERGITKQFEQAQAVGESAPAWNRYLKSERSPRMVTVQNWLTSAERAGHPLRMAVTSREATVEPFSPPGTTLMHILCCDGCKAPITLCDCEGES